MTSGRSKIVPYLFILPTIVLFSLIFVYPVSFSIILSMYKWPIVSPKKYFVGLANFRWLFSYHVFHLAFWHTLYFVAGEVGLKFAFGLLFAILANAVIKPLRIFMRSTFFIPVVTSLVALCVVWGWLYNPTFGFFNYFLSFVGLPPQSWLADMNLVMPSIILMSAWAGLGYNTVIFLAGLIGIPKIYYDAAQIDGANKWHSFLHVTLPLLKPTILLVLVITTIWSMQVFTQIYVLTRGGPADASTVLNYEVYRIAFVSLRAGRAAAMSMITFIVLIVLTFVQLRVLRVKWVY